MYRPPGGGGGGEEEEDGLLAGMLFLSRSAHTQGDFEGRAGSAYPKESYRLDDAQFKVECPARQVF